MHYLRFFQGKFQSDRLRHAPRERIDAYRERALRAAVRYAFLHSPFYRSLYLEHGIKDKDLPDVQLADLPEVSKKVLMENFDQVATRHEVRQSPLTAFFRDNKDPAAKLHGKYIAMHSSGTSGTLGMFVLSSGEFARVLASMASHSESAKSAGHRLAYFGAIDGHYAGSTLLSQVPRAMMRCELFSVLAPLRQTVTAINEYQPDALSGYASAIALLAEEQLAGRLRIRPTRVSCGAEPLTDGIRELVTRAFGVATRNAYGACESLNIAYQCSDSSTDMVLSEDLYACEFSENLHVTSLYARVMPIIRYRIDDRVVLSKQQPARGFRSIASIDGRTEQWLDIPLRDGGMDRLIAPALANFYVPGLERIQFRQREDSHIEVHYTGQDDIATRVKERLWELVTAKNPSSEISVTVRHCDTIAASRDTGKTSLIVKHA